MTRSRFIKISVFLLLTFAFASSSHAVYNANISGSVAHLTVYTDGDYIYLVLHNQPTSHPGCNPSNFVIPDTIPQNRRNQLYAQLVAAKLTGETVSIGYDNTGDCFHGYIRVHAVSI
jgi:hypothetical protein